MSKLKIDQIVEDCILLSTSLPQISVAECIELTKIVHSHNCRVCDYPEYQSKFIQHPEEIILHLKSIIVNNDFEAVIFNKRVADRTYKIIIKFIQLDSKNMAQILIYKSEPDRRIPDAST